MSKEKIAVPLEGTGEGPRGVVLLNNGERMTRKEAKAKGWKIHGEPDADNAADNTLDTANAATLKAHKAWRSSVLSLPEARGRESAAVEIVTSQTADTMPVVSARAFLRGLPTEQPEEKPALSTNANANDPRATRLAEIQNTVTAFNKNSGHAAKATSKAPPSLSSIDPAKLRRLTEIRLNALDSDHASPVSLNEAKLLRYALTVEGIPLASTLKTLGVDTSKLRI